jgi:hypothetical protein
VTVRHHAGQSLTSTLGALTKGMARIGQDKAVKALRASMGYLGRIQALEVTTGAHGWHPHRHPLVTFSRPVGAEEVAELHAAEFRAFRAGVVHAGFDAPTMDGQQLRPVTMNGAAVAFGEYFTKSGWAPDRAAWEMTGAQGKKGRSGSRGAFELLNGVMRGDADDLELWNEYEKTTKGKRAITWSRGLRDLLGVGAERTDEDIADAEVGDRDDTGFYVADWTPIAAQPVLGAMLLDVVGPAGDWDAGRAFCALHGIEIAEVEL